MQEVTLCCTCALLEIQGWEVGWCAQLRQAVQCCLALSMKRHSCNTSKLWQHMENLRLQSTRRPSARVCCPQATWYNLFSPWLEVTKSRLAEIFREQESCWILTFKPRLRRSLLQLHHVPRDSPLLQWCPQKFGCMHTTRTSTSNCLLYLLLIPPYMGGFVCLCVWIHCEYIVNTESVPCGLTFLGEEFWTKRGVALISQTDD